MNSKIPLLLLSHHNHPVSLRIQLLPEEHLGLQLYGSIDPKIGLPPPVLIHVTFGFFIIFQEINHPAVHPHPHGSPISQQLSCISLDKMQEDCPFLGAAARSSRDATKPPDDSRDSRSSHAHQLRGFLGFRGETPMDMCHDQNKTILLSPNEKA